MRRIMAAVVMLMAAAGGAEAQQAPRPAGPLSIEGAQEQLEVRLRGDRSPATVTAVDPAGRWLRLAGGALVGLALADYVATGPELGLDGTGAATFGTGLALFGWGAWRDAEPAAPVLAEGR